MYFNFTINQINIKTYIYLIKKIWYWVCTHKLLTFVLIISTGVCIGVLYYALNFLYQNYQKPYALDRVCVGDVDIDITTQPLPENYTLPQGTVIRTNPETGRESVVLPSNAGGDYLNSSVNGNQFTIFNIRRCLSVDETLSLFRKNPYKIIPGIHSQVHEIIEILFPDNIKWDQFGRPYYIINDLVVEILEKKLNIDKNELVYIIDFIDYNHYGAIQKDVAEALYTIRFNELQYRNALQFLGIGSEVFKVYLIYAAIGGASYGLCSIFQYVWEIASALNAC